ncbi:hypothetical protein LOD99_557 [Oopsacas minuta]|uniref:Uncharacterized protein n=1 Tax=Oopsacas minuta TaxID=111878 RepID=A0AAV7KA81_9METZ|nr:hypothetical protein LOD99_557 [Oopsacas minuta]
MAEKSNNDPTTPQLFVAKKKRLVPVKERIPWIKDIDDLYFYGSKKESDTNVFVKKYMRAAYWLFKYEIAHMTFNHQDWTTIINQLQMQAFVTRALADEARHISKHVSLSPQIDKSSPQKFLQSFLKDKHTREMLIEHSSVSALILVLPLGSCSVE